MSRRRPDRTLGVRRAHITHAHDRDRTLGVQVRHGRRGVGLHDRARGPWAHGRGDDGYTPDLSGRGTVRPIRGPIRRLAAALVLLLLALLALLAAVVFITGQDTPNRTPPIRSAPTTAAAITAGPAAAASRKAPPPRASRSRRPAAAAPAVAPAPDPLAPYRAFLRCTRRHESDTSGGYRAVSPTGRYRGAYQFDLPTWRSVGGRGDPAAAPPAEQDRRAAALAAERGAQPWRGRCASLLHREERHG